MHHTTRFFILGFFSAIQFATNPLSGGESNEHTTELTQVIPFAGKITRNKVRMRLKPTLDSAVIRELNKDDLYVILSEQDEFYGIQAPNDVKAYIYRTFVLDNIVEGNHVNVRLEPSIDAPVIAQLNSGETINGVISPLNSKWLEISIPKNTQFYVSKDFVEKIGEPTLVETVAKRRENVNRLLESTYQISELELQKPYQHIQMEGIFQSLNKIISDKNNLPSQIEKAKEMLSSIQNKYLEKKIAFLEEKPLPIANLQMSKEPVVTIKEEPRYKNHITTKMSFWVPTEENIYQNWLTENPNDTKDEFYLKQDTITLQGLLETYDRSVKNKPGDYMLVNSSNQLPIAYLYSTKVNLQDFLGQEITLNVQSRPNNSFAFPAYFVLSVE